MNQSADSASTLLLLQKLCYKNSKTFVLKTDGRISEGVNSHDFVEAPR